MRKPQNGADKGSQKWIQYLVNERPRVLNDAIARDLPECSSIQWLSPLKKDSYAEYRDNDFLKRLSLNSIPRLSCFWPRNGPQWDALGKCSDGRVILVEAKSHLKELNSDMGAVAPRSISTIKKALKHTKNYYKVDQSIDWTRDYYQYANRIATRFYLNEWCEQLASLVFVYFADDPTVDLPVTVNGWKGHILGVRGRLGLPETVPHVGDIIIDVSSLK